jgi:ubiquinone/menaquinone biosynthesis C-methylase UbiE
MKRIVRAELLDTDAGTPTEIERSLTDLRLVNRWFGGVATTTALLKQVATTTCRTDITVLEVAAGTGYVPDSTRQRLEGCGINLTMTLLDRRITHLPGSGARVVGDALALPFRDQSFDVVTCGLFAHHLEPDALVAFVNEGLRVARVALLINDLIRHPVHLGLVYASLPLHGRLSRHDGPASVRRSYTTREMTDMLARTTAARIEITRHYLFRMGVIAWREASQNLAQ